MGLFSFDPIPEFSRAVLAGDLDGAHLLLIKKPFDLNTLDSKTNTPLWMLLLIIMPDRLRPNAARFFLTSGANPDARDKECGGNIIYNLIRAYRSQLVNCEECSVITLKELVVCGVSIDAPCCGGELNDYVAGDTALHAVAIREELSYSQMERVIFSLLEVGADLNLKNESGWTPAYAIFWNLLIFVESNTRPEPECFAMLSRLVRAGFKVTTTSDADRTLLHVACIQPHDVSILKFLIDNGALVNARDSGGNTPLHNAAANSLKESCEYLLAVGALTHLANTELDTPLHLCTSSAIARLLIENGAKLDIRNNNGQTPLEKITFEIERLARVIDGNATKSEVEIVENWGIDASTKAIWLESFRDLEGYYHSLTKREQTYVPLTINWKYSIDGETMIDCDQESLLGMIRNHQIKSTVLVWKDGMETWLPIKDIPELTRGTAEEQNVSGVKSVQGTAIDKNDKFNPRETAITKSNDSIANLERLAKLYESGLIDKDEFNLAKKNILAG